MSKLQPIVGIYKITSPSGKVYIGQSWNITKRWTYYLNNKSNKQVFLLRSFNKYGKSAHVFEIIHELPKDVSQLILDNYEISYMEYYRAVGIELMNIKEGGSRGRLPEEIRRKIGLSKIGNKNRVGLKHSAETRKKISKNRGKHPTWNTGKPWNEDAKRKMSKSRLGKQPWNKGLKGAQIASPETRGKLSSLHLKNWVTRKESIFPYPGKTVFHVHIEYGIFKTLAEVAKEHETTATTIRQMMDGERINNTKYIRI